MFISIKFRFSRNCFSVRLFRLIIFKNKCNFSCWRTFNPFLKILCIFPWRYFLPIESENILDITWHILPYLQCSPKQCDLQASFGTPYNMYIEMTSHPFFDILFRIILHISKHIFHTMLQPWITVGFGYEHFPIHSPLLTLFSVVCICLHLPICLKSVSTSCYNWSKCEIYWTSQSCVRFYNLLIFVRKPRDCFISDIIQ